MAQPRADRARLAQPIVLQQQRLQLERALEPAHVHHVVGVEPELAQVAERVETLDRADAVEGEIQQPQPHATAEAEHRAQLLVVERQFVHLCLILALRRLQDSLARDERSIARGCRANEHLQSGTCPPVGV